MYQILTYAKMLHLQNIPLNFQKIIRHFSSQTLFVCTSTQVHQQFQLKKKTKTKEIAGN